MNTLGDALRSLLINLVCDENEEGVELEPEQDGVYHPMKLLQTLQQTWKGANYPSIERELNSFKSRGILGPMYILDVVEKHRTYPSLYGGKRRRYYLLTNNSIIRRF